MRLILAGLCLCAGCGDASGVAPAGGFSEKSVSYETPITDETARIEFADIVDLPRSQELAKIALPAEMKRGEQVVYAGRIVSSNGENERPEILYAKWVQEPKIDDTIQQESSTAVKYTGEVGEYHYVEKAPAAKGKMRLTLYFIYPGKTENVPVATGVTTIK